MPLMYGDDLQTLTVRSVPYLTVYTTVTRWTAATLPYRGVKYEHLDGGVSLLVSETRNQHQHHLNDR